MLSRSHNIYSKLEKNPREKPSVAAPPRVFHSDFSLVFREYLWIRFANLCILSQYFAKREVTRVNLLQCQGHRRRRRRSCQCSGRRPRSRRLGQDAGTASRQPAAKVGHDGRGDGNAHFDEVRGETDEGKGGSGGGHEEERLEGVRAEVEGVEGQRGEPSATDGQQEEPGDGR